jgi:hypothetical protein
MEKEEKEKDEKVESPNNMSKDIVWNTSLTNMLFQVDVEQESVRALTLFLEVNN